MASALFVQDGKPMAFFLCNIAKSEATKWIKLIQDLGGEVHNTYNANVKALAKDTHNVSITDQPIYSLKFVEECAKKNELLDIDHFQFATPPTTKASSSPSPSPKKVATSPRKWKRVAYTKEDDNKLLQFISEHPDLSPGGTKLWRLMENQKVTDHTWESLRTRFRHLKSASNKENVTEQESEPDYDLGNDYSKRQRDLRQHRVNNIIENLSTQFQVPKSIIFHSLLSFNGDITLAIDYLQRRDNCAEKPWSREEDEQLSSGTVAPELLHERDEQHIRDRLNFLEQLHKLGSSDEE